MPKQPSPLSREQKEERTRMVETWCRDNDVKRDYSHSEPPVVKDTSRWSRGTFCEHIRNALKDAKKPLSAGQIINLTMFPYRNVMNALRYLRDTEQVFYEKPNFPGKPGHYSLARTKKSNPDT